MAPSVPNASSDRGAGRPAANRGARARAAVSAALITLVVGGQILAVGELCGARWPPASVTLPLVMMVAPLAAAAWRYRRGEVGSAFARGLLLAPAAWALWAGSYYLVAALAAPGRAVVLSEGLVARVPFVPAVASVYLGVHPLSVLPLARAETAAALRRTALGFVVIVAVSVVAWAWVPVSFPRALAPTGDGFGAWLLTTIRGSDPPVNCLPSTHCAMAVHAALRLREAPRLLAGWSALTAVAIAASTMMLRQHYAVDVAAGVALGLGVAWGVDRWA